MAHDNSRKIAIIEEKIYVLKAVLEDIQYLDLIAVTFNDNQERELSTRLFRRIREIVLARKLLMERSKNSKIKYGTCSFSVYDKRLREYNKALKAVKKRLYRYLRNNKSVDYIILIFEKHNADCLLLNSFDDLANIIKKDINTLENNKKNIVKKEKPNINKNKENNADIILASSTKNDDQKLFEIFNLYKEDIKRQNPQLYYALLGWKDSHLREFKL